MDHHQFRRLPKGERRVRFADSMGMELVSIFLFDLISNYYFASIHNHKQLPPPNTIPAGKQATNLSPRVKSSQILRNSILSAKRAPDCPQEPASKTCQPRVLSNSQFKCNQEQTRQQQQEQQQQPPALAHKTSSSPHVDCNQPGEQLAASQAACRPQANSLIAAGGGEQQQQLAHYVCEFTQPISLISFKERVKLNKVHLETCSVNSRAGNISVSCTIRVLNLSYDKSVIVRYTTDEWHTHTDCLASYKPGSNDGWSDKFTCTFSVTNQVRQLQAGQRIVFAVRYSCAGDKLYWDNNGGLNYALKKLTS